MPEPKKDDSAKPRPSDPAPAAETHKAEKEQSVSCKSYREAAKSYGGAGDFTALASLLEEVLSSCAELETAEKDAIKLNLALAYLRSGKENEAKEVLDELAPSGL